MTTARRLARLYALFGCIAVLLIALTMPPMQNPDEGSHSYRADQISHLDMLGRHIPDGEVGGLVDAGLVTEWLRVEAIRFHPAAKVSREMVKPTGWGTRVPISFPNTAVYPPLLYLPAALMAAAGRSLRIELPKGLVLMRIASGAVSIALTTTAIALADNAAIWLFAIALLPMSLSLDAAVSQDGPMLACVALAVVLHLRLQAGDRRYRRSCFAAMCLLLVVVAMARPPYAALGVLTLVAPVRILARLAGLACILAGVAGWSILNISNVWLSPAVEPRLQLAGLAAHPWRLPMLFLTTWRALDDYLLTSFIGLLGWLDVVLPPWYHRCAWLALVLAAAASWRAGEGRIRGAAAAASALAVLGAVSGIGLLQYLTWTPLGAPVIDGLQGRYFLAPAMVMGALLGRPRVAGGRTVQWLMMPVALFPVVTIAVVLHAVVLRYYI